MSLLVRGCAVRPARATAAEPMRTRTVAARAGTLRTVHTAATNRVQATAYPASRRPGALWLSPAWRVSTTPAVRAARRTAVTPSRQRALRTVGRGEGGMAERPGSGPGRGAGFGTGGAAPPG